MAYPTKSLLAEELYAVVHTEKAIAHQQPHIPTYVSQQIKQVVVIMIRFLHVPSTCIIKVSCIITSRVGWIFYSVKDVDCKLVPLT